MLSKVEREDDNLPPRKKAKSRLGCAAEWKVWYGKEKSYVSDIYIYIYIYIFGYDYYYFQNSGASSDDFFLNAFKTLLRLFRVIKISKNAF